MSYYIIESTNSDKTFKCPFCKFHGTKEQIVSHVDKVHADMIPENYTAARVVFNYFNKKESGHCVICGDETPWNEENWRYDRFCHKNNDECKKLYVKDFKKVRMVNKYGKEHLLDDANQQKKMLSNRSISGTYKFKDGGVREYCGTYELKALEFYDKVLGVPSSDIMTPGPTFEYEYKGKTHQWITDIFYIPLQLIHDVKDGGNNPNNREMPEYREKQEAKENMIKSLNKCNYIRLTDNNFEQLLFILADIKYSMMDPDSSNRDYKVHINELASTMGALPPANQDNELYLVNYDKEDGKNGYALANSIYLDKMFVVGEDQHLHMESFYFLHNANYSVYKYDSEESFYIWGKVLNDYSDKAFVRTKDYFYNKMTKKQLLNEDQLDFDSNFVAMESVYDSVVYKMDNVLNSIKLEAYSLLPNSLEVKKSNIIEEFSLLNMISEISSTLNTNYKSKEKYTLSKFTKSDLTDATVSKYKSELKHMRINKNTKGYVYTDKNNIVACINTETKDDGDIWCLAIEIFRDYKSHGLSKQLLDVLIKELKVTKLSVNKKNNVAIKLYKDYGFKQFNSDNNMIYMKIGGKL